MRQSDVHVKVEEEADAMRAVMMEYVGDPRPASTMICVNNLSSPCAGTELDMIAVGGSS